MPSARSSSRSTSLIQINSRRQPRHTTAATALIEQEERQPLVGGPLHRRTDAAELVWVVVAETSCATARTSPDCTPDPHRADRAPAAAATSFGVATPSAFALAARDRAVTEPDEPPLCSRDHPGQLLAVDASIDRADRLDVAVVVNDHAAVLGEHLSGTLGSEQQRHL